MEISNRFCSSHPFCDLTSLIYWKYPIMRSYSPQSPILLDISNNNRRTDTKKRPCSFSLQRRFARGSTLLRMGRPYNPSPARQAHSARGRRPPGQAPGAVRVAPSLGRTSASLERPAERRTPSLFAVLNADETAEATSPGQGVLASAAPGCISAGRIRITSSLDSSVRGPHEGSRLSSLVNTASKRTSPDLCRWKLRRPSSFPFVASPALNDVVCLPLYYLKAHELTRIKKTRGCRRLV